MTNFVHKRTVRVGWGDCDPAQIVFYPNYFAWFDESTAEMFRAALGMPKIKWTKKFGLVGFPMVDTRAKFMIPSFYGDDIVIESQVTEFRKSSFDVAHRVFKGDKLAIEGFETRVMVETDATRPGGIKSAVIPQAIQDAFKKPA